MRKKMILFLLVYIYIFSYSSAVYGEDVTDSRTERQITQWDIQQVTDDMVLEVNIIENPPPIPSSPLPLNLPEGGRPVKILLYKDLKEVSLSCDGDFTLQNRMMKFCLKSGYLLNLKVSPGEREDKSRRHGIIKNINKSEDIIEIKPEEENKIVEFVFSDKDGNCTVKSFRGKILIFINSEKKLTVINQLSLNEYLAGVVPNEMPAFFPMEALKAQAIVARTYTVKHLNTHKKDGADLCSTVHCHVYGGMDGETEKTNQAVKDTIHQMVFYNQEVADTVYHSTCGGITCNIENSWELSPVSYLVSVPDQSQPVKEKFLTEEEFREFIDNPGYCYCQESGKFRWQDIYTKEELEKLYAESIPVILKDPSLKLGKLIDISVEKRMEDGRVSILLIKGTEGEYRIEKDKIRWLTSGGKIAKGGLSSTLFYIYKPDENTFCFTGGGWGHGIGLCQYGAKGMADAGYTALEIIEHYYPGCVVKEELWFHQ